MKNYHLNNGISVLCKKQTIANKEILKNLVIGVLKKKSGFVYTPLALIRKKQMKEIGSIYLTMA